jgi:tetratricopeptide (TPR) repeat protein
MRTLLAVFVFLSAPWLSVGAAAQTDLSEAKTQYEEAAYEDALTTLTKASASTPADRVQLEQYRALCLIALGRLPEAERAVSALVEADPTYVPPSSVASPRVLAMVADIRRKELPGVTRRVLDSGRAAYEAKNIPLAQRQFDLLLNLLDDPAMEGRPEREDLRAVAQGSARCWSRPPPLPVPLPPLSRSARPRHRLHRQRHPHRRRPQRARSCRPSSFRKHCRSGRRPIRRSPGTNTTERSRCGLALMDA